MNKAFCTECGVRYLSDEAFCTACGAPRGGIGASSSPEVDSNVAKDFPACDIACFCTSCGARRDPDKRFCTECGAPAGDVISKAIADELGVEESCCEQEHSGEDAGFVAGNEETAPLAPVQPVAAFAVAPAAGATAQGVLAPPAPVQRVEANVASGREAVYGGSAEPKRRGRKGGKIAACVAIAVVLVAGGGVVAFAALGNGWLPVATETSSDRPQTDALAEEPVGDGPTSEELGSEANDAVEGEAETPKDTQTPEGAVEKGGTLGADTAAKEAASEEKAAAVSPNDSKSADKRDATTAQSEHTKPQEPAVADEPPLSLDDEETHFLVNRYLSNFTEQPALSQGYDADDIRGTVLFTFAQLYVLNNSPDSIVFENGGTYINWADMQYYTELMLKTELTKSMIPGGIDVEDGYVLHLSHMGSCSTGVAYATEMEKVGEGIYAVNFDVYGNSYYDVSDESFYRMTEDELGDYFGRFGGGFDQPVAYGTALIETGYDDTPAAPYKLLYYEFHDLLSKFYEY